MRPVETSYGSTRNTVPWKRTASIRLQHQLPSSLSATGTPAKRTLSQFQICSTPFGRSPWRMTWEIAHDARFSGWDWEGFSLSTSRNHNFCCTLRRAPHSRMSLNWGLRRQRGTDVWQIFLCYFWCLPNVIRYHVLEKISLTLRKPFHDQNSARAENVFPRLLSIKLQDLYMVGE